MPALCLSQATLHPDTCQKCVEICPLLCAKDMSVLITGLITVMFAVTQTGNNSVTVKSKMKTKLLCIPSIEILQNDEKELIIANVTTWIVS